MVQHQRHTELSHTKHNQPATLAPRKLHKYHTRHKVHGVLKQTDCMSNGQELLSSSNARTRLAVVQAGSVDAAWAGFIRKWTSSELEARDDTDTSAPATCSMRELASGLASAQGEAGGDS